MLNSDNQTVTTEYFSQLEERCDALWRSQYDTRKCDAYRLIYHDRA
jgi:hypothetical protein